MMDIVDLRYLAAAGNAGNFGRTAMSLGLDTSTISHRNGRLEGELGFALFEQAKSGVHLTAGGRSLMGHVNRILAEFEGVVRAAGDRTTRQGEVVRHHSLVPLLKRISPVRTGHLKVDGMSCCDCAPL